MKRRALLAALLPTPALAHAETGWASWYAHGRTTANGERYNRHAMTAAHRHLPFNTRVRVERLDTNASVVVRINDRGPHVRGRIIDLSEAAGRHLGIHSSGVAPVKLHTL